MNVAEAWQKSRIPYKEVVYRSLAEEKGRMWWGAFGIGQQGDGGPSDLELTERALRIAKFDKIIVAIFNIIVAAIPFAPYFLGTADFGLASSVALSLIVTFGFTTLYAIQTLTSFVGAESTALLATLPITQADFSLITLFSFVRSVDYMVIGAVLSQVLLVAAVTVSPLAVLAALAASLINAVFAVVLALWFSRVFQKNLMRGGRSRANSALRIVFILMWGLLLAGVGFIFTIPWYVVPDLEGVVLGQGGLSAFLSAVFPFSAGIVIADLANSGVTRSVVSIASAASMAYALLSVLAGRWSMSTVMNIAKGAGVKIARVAAKDFLVTPRAPLLGYVLKDLKISSRNPATAFFFALPFLETLATILLISNFGALRTAAVLMASAMGAIFALISPLSLLSAEGRGLEYTKVLPISSRRVVVSKALISTAAYAFVPLALVGLSLFLPLTSASSILIPFIATVSVASASIFEIVLFLRTTGKGQISAIFNEVQKLFIGVIIVLIPMAAYAALYLLVFSHVASLMVMVATTLMELAIALYVIRK